MIKRVFGLLIFLFFISFSYADLGNFNDYSDDSYSSNSFSSGSSSSSFSSSSSRDSFSSHSDNDFFSRDSDHSNQVKHSTSDSKEGILFIGIVLVVFSFRILVHLLSQSNSTFSFPNFMVTFLEFLSRKDSSDSSLCNEEIRDEGSSSLNDAPIDHTDSIVEVIKQGDDNFNLSAFLEWVRQTFTILQMAWSDRDMEKVQHLESIQLYEQHKLQVEEFIQKNLINVIDKIDVKEAYLFEYIQEESSEYLRVYLEVSMIDYIKRENTDTVLKGSPLTPSSMRYLYTFKRSRKTTVIGDQQEQEAAEMKCPSCGAPLNISGIGMCEYCGFNIVAPYDEWVLSDIVAVKPGINIGNGGIQICTIKK